MSAHVLSHLLDTRFGIASQLITEATSPNNTETLGTILQESIGRQVHAILPDTIAIVPGYVSVRGKSIL